MSHSQQQVTSVMEEQRTGGAAAAAGHASEATSHPPDSQTNGAAAAAAAPAAAAAANSLSHRSVTPTIAPSSSPAHSDAHFLSPSSVTASASAEPSGSDSNHGGGSTGSAGGSVDGGGSWKLFVGAIPEQTSEDELRALFAPYGEIVDLVILHDRFTRQPRGCGFVVFASKESADEALAAVADKARLPGSVRELIVRYAGPRPEETDFKLYVSMLSHLTGEEEVRALFGQFGPLSEVVLLREKDSALSKGSAFVKFHTRDAAEAAIHTLDKRYKDKNSPAMLQVRYAHTRDEKEAHFRHKSPQMTSLPPGSDAMTSGSPYNQQLLQQLTQAQAGNALLQALLQQQVASAQSQQQNGHLLRLMNLQGSQLPPSQPQQQQPQLPLPHHQRHPSHPSSAYAAAQSLHSHQSSAAAAAVAASTVAHSSAYYPQPPSQQQQQQQQQQPDVRASLPQKDVRGPEGANVFVYNVPDYFSELQLQHLFGAYGPLVSVKIQRDRQSGAGKGYGFASFVEPRSAQAAIANLDGLIIDGKKLTVRIKTAAQEQSMNQQQHQPQHPHPHPHAAAAYPHQQQYAQQLRYQPQAQQSQHNVRSSMQSHHGLHDRGSPISASYSPSSNSPAHHSHPSAAGLGDLSASLSGLNLGSSSLQSNVNGVGGGGGGFFSSNVASQPAHAAPSFDAVMQQALYLSQLQQQQQQGQSLPLHPLPAASLASSSTAQGRGIYSAPPSQSVRQPQPQRHYDSQERQLQMLVAANPQLQLHMAAPQYTSHSQQPGSSY